MEKAPIKKFAVEARRKLIADVTFQLERYGITEKASWSRRPARTRSWCLTLATAMSKPFVACGL